MSDTEIVTETEDAPKPKRVYYTNAQAKDILVDKLRTNKVGYLSITVSTKAIEIAQLGEHESAGAIMKLFTLPGIYGPSETKPLVRLDRDQFGVVTRTVLTLSRDGAEPMFANDGINDDNEGTERAPDAVTAETEASNVVVAPIAGTPEAFDQYTEAELDEILEAHGIEDGTFETVEAKLDAAKKIVFID